MIPAAAANMNGGHVMSNVAVVLKPKVLTTLVRIILCQSCCLVRYNGLRLTYVGKKELKEQALR